MFFFSSPCSSLSWLTLLQLFHATAGIICSTATECSTSRSALEALRCSEVSARLSRTPTGPRVRSRPARFTGSCRSVMMSRRAWPLCSDPGRRENRHDHYKGCARAATTRTPACRGTPRSPIETTLPTPCHPGSSTGAGDPRVAGSPSGRRAVVRSAHCRRRWCFC